MKFNDYVSQAVKRACAVKTRGACKGGRSPKWFDVECRGRRIDAINAGKRVINDADIARLKQSCKEYKACKQRKYRQYRQARIDNIDYVFHNDKSNMWMCLQAKNIKKSFST
jgi:hypothetical protein